jgi:acetate CoA/acetoacetate CoA-transferase beta subunit
MEPQTIIARRIARELSPGMLVNLGIGIPTLVASHLPDGMQVFFQSENGLIGTGSIPEEGMAHPTLTDATGRPVTALPGASTFDSAMSFGLIRGGHLDLTVLGGLQVDQTGQLAKWMIPNKMVPGMGGAMDLVSGAKRVIVAMQHTAKGSSKIVKKCTLPVTSIRPVDLVVTELAVISFPDGRATLRETGPGISVAEVVEATEAELVVPNHVPETPQRASAKRSCVGSCRQASCSVKSKCKCGSERTDP